MEHEPIDCCAYWAAASTRCLHACASSCPGDCLQKRVVGLVAPASIQAGRIRAAGTTGRFPAGFVGWESYYTRRTRGARSGPQAR